MLNLASSIVCAAVHSDCRLTVQEMVIGFYQLTSGLNHMHVRQIVDQDIHRGNVLISKGDGSWKKGDLGSAARCKRDDGEWNYIHPKDCRCASGCHTNVMMIALAVHAFVTLTRTECRMTRPMQDQHMSPGMSDSRIGDKY